MIVFCMLWMPLVLLFRRSLGYRTRSSAGLLTAVVLGLITALIGYLLGPMFSPSDFDRSLFFYALVEMIALPVLIPLVVRSAFALRGGNPEIDYGEFALLWLMPVAIMHGVFWSAQPEPLHLVLVPVLWSSVAVGVPCLVNHYREELGILSVLSLLAAVLLPFAAALSYQAFFADRAILGVVLLLASLLPTVVQSALAMPAALRGSMENR